MIDRCTESYFKGGVPCEKPTQEKPVQLPPPNGPDYCPYVGCSQDPRYQFPRNVGKKIRRSGKGYPENGNGWHKA